MNIRAIRHNYLFKSIKSIKSAFDIQTYLHYLSGLNMDFTLTSKCFLLQVT